MAILNERKSYAVFWRHKFYGEWLRSCEWAETPDAARQELNRIKKNSRCAGAKVVERTESFQTMEEWENEK